MPSINISALKNLFNISKLRNCQHINCNSLKIVSTNYSTNSKDFSESDVAKKIIETTVNSNPVVLFMKGSPEAPMVIKKKII